MEKQDDIPMIPKYQAEAQMMHMSIAIRSIVTVCAIFAFTIMVAIWVFVNGYTSRTKDWLNTLAGLQEKPAVTEVGNGIQQQPDT